MTDARTHGACATNVPEAHVTVPCATVLSCDGYRALPTTAASPGRTDPGSKIALEGPETLPDRISGISGISGERLNVPVSFSPRNVGGCFSNSMPST